MPMVKRLPRDTMRPWSRASTAMLKFVEENGRLFESVMASLQLHASLAHLAKEERCFYRAMRLRRWAMRREEPR